LNVFFFNYKAPSPVESKVSTADFLSITNPEEEKTLSPCPHSPQQAEGNSLAGDKGTFAGFAGGAGVNKRSDFALQPTDFHRK
jgi:hypothetical protein